MSKQSNGSDVSKPSLMPLGDRVLIKPLSEDEMAIKSPSGIIIPDTAQKEKPMQGTVMAVGEGRYTDDGKLVPMKLKSGDRVVFSKYSPDEITLDGEEYYILNEGSILAIVK